MEKEAQQIALARSIVYTASMILGFTGTRRGMTRAQSANLLEHLLEYGKGRDRIIQLHHGDCVGADKEINDMVVAYDMVDYIHIHPPLDTQYTAYCEGVGEKYHIPVTMYEHKLYLDRNDDIVASCEKLIACPYEPEEIVRSDTWYTIRRASEADKDIVIIYPDGTIRAGKIKLKR